MEFKPMKFNRIFLALVCSISLFGVACSGRTSSSVPQSSSGGSSGGSTSTNSRTVGELYDAAGINPYETGCDNLGRCQGDFEVLPSGEIYYY
ncbi:UNVERIFIED_CONTAM: hypothetical protein BEN50_15740 [Euhalothece sp. KZN 001]